MTFTCKATLSRTFGLADDRHLSSGPLVVGAGLLRCLRAADRLHIATGCDRGTDSPPAVRRGTSPVRTAGSIIQSMRCSVRTAATTSPLDHAPSAGGR